MIEVRAVPIFVGLAVAVVVGILLWVVRRTRAADPAGLKEDDWGGRALVWLLVLAAFVTGAFVSYALLRP